MKREHEDTSVDTAIAWADEKLEQDDASGLWQIGKKMKSLVEADLPPIQEAQVYFIWGSALARLALQEENPELAQAAIDKFETLEAKEGESEESIGSTGLTLWGACLLLLGFEQQQLPLISSALLKYKVGYACM